MKRERKTVAKFTMDDLDMAIANLSMLKFFPTDAATRAAIRVFLARICLDAEALDWLVSTMVNRIGEWPGPMELRGVLCTRFRPADGIEADCSIKGFRPVDAEERQIERHEAIKVGGYELPEDDEVRRLVESVVDSKRWLQ